MARGTVSARSKPPTSTRTPRLTLLVVEVPANWRPNYTRDTPPRYDLVDRAGRFDATLAREIQGEFNTAEIAARRAGRPRNLWMVARAVEGGAA